MGRPAVIRDRGQTLAEISALTNVSYSALTVRYARRLRGKALRAPRRLAGPKRAKMKGGPLFRARDVLMEGGKDPLISLLLSVPSSELRQWDMATYHFNKRRPGREAATLNDYVRAAMSLLVAHAPK